MFFHMFYCLLFYCFSVSLCFTVFHCVSLCFTVFHCVSLCFTVFHCLCNFFGKSLVSEIWCSHKLDIFKGQFPIARTPRLYDVTRTNFFPGNIILKAGLGERDPTAAKISDISAKKILPEE
jgi:hypothetical protein